MQEKKTELMRFQYVSELIQFPEMAISYKKKQYKISSNTFIVENQQLRRDPNHNQNNFLL